MVKMYYKWKMKILYIDYNDITKHVVLQDVMEHAVNKFYNKNKMRQHVDACVARMWISYRCVPCHPWCTHQTSLVVKKNIFSLPVAENNSIR